MKTNALLIHWFRRDLRIDDNPGISRLLDDCRRLRQAETPGLAIVFVYAGRPRLATAGDIWLEQSLRALDERLRGHFRLPLYVAGGGWPETLSAILDRHSGPESHLYYGELFEPEEAALADTVDELCRARGCQVHRSPGNYLLSPEQYRRGSGEPYKVYSAFARHIQPRLPLYDSDKPRRVDLGSHHLDLPGLEPLAARQSAGDPLWTGKLGAHCRAGENAAHAAWEEFLDRKLGRYALSRDFFAANETSQMSAHLHFGEISVRRLHNDVRALRMDGLDEPAGRFVGSLLWREYANSWLIHKPAMTGEPMRPEFAGYPWRDDGDSLALWQRGQTGYPVIDAAMRGLWATGRMHNRLRMIVASFLVKHLLIDWRRGLDWFEHTLFDYDMANNAMSWQWSAGSGFDSAPYFRVFNPLLQSAKFDPDGDFIRANVEELTDYRGDNIHNPDPLERGRYGYPPACIEHKPARQRALATWRLLARRR